MSSLHFKPEGEGLYRESPTASQCPCNLRSPVDKCLTPTCKAYRARDSLAPPLTRV